MQENRKRYFKVLLEIIQENKKRYLILISFFGKVSHISFAGWHPRCRTGLRNSVNQGN